MTEFIKFIAEFMDIIVPVTIVVIAILIGISSYLYGMVTSHKNISDAKSKLIDAQIVYIKELEQELKTSELFVENQRLQIDIMGKTIESLDKLCELNNLKLKIMESEKLELENKMSSAGIQEKTNAKLTKTRRTKNV